MNNFSKEYIKECDCEEIQKLRSELKVGDWEYSFPYNRKRKDISLIDRIDFSFNRSEITWLPTGDQLDEEIKQICMKNLLLVYEISWVGTCWEAYILERHYPKPKTIMFEGSDNPLICKIKLLKALLKEN